MSLTQSGFLTSWLMLWKVNAVFHSLVAPSQRSQAPLADSGYGSNSSFNSTSSRSMSTQAGQRNITDMFSPNTMRVTSGSRNNNSQANRSTGSNSSSFNTSNSYDSSNISRNMNGFSNSGNSFSNAPAGRGSARQPLAVVTGNTRNSGNNFNQSGGGMTGNSRNFGSNLNQSGGSSRLPITGGGDADGENKIVCNCGNDALQLTVRKEGPNTGKQTILFIFYPPNSNNLKNKKIQCWHKSGDVLRQIIFRKVFKII